MLQRELFALLGGTEDAAIAIDTQCRICFSNRAAQRLFGDRLQEPFGKRCIDLLQGRSEHGEMVCRERCTVFERATEELPIPSFDMEITTEHGAIWVSTSTIVTFTREESPTIVHLLRNAERGKRMEMLMQRILDEVYDVTGQEVHVAPTRDRLRPRLSGREEFVLRLLTEDLSSKEIAYRLGCSIATVRNHIQHVLRKLAVHSRSAAVLRAVREHLV